MAFSSGHDGIAVTLWAAHTHFIPRFDGTGRLVLLSPEPECGKTRVLELLDRVCSGGETYSNVSPSYLFRRIGTDDAPPVTLLIDEADAIWRAKGDESAEAVRSIVNAGYRKGATVGRTEMNSHGAKLVRYKVFAPVALAAWAKTGNPLPDTIMSRALTIWLRRRAPGQRLRAFRFRTAEEEGTPLRARLAAWAEQAGEKIGDPWPELPAVLRDRDRAAEIWEPLIAVADLAGGEWPALARAACTAIAGGAGAQDNLTEGARLLSDIRAVWPRPARGRGTEGTGGTALISMVPPVPLVPLLGTGELLAKLRALEDAPWAELGKDRHPLTARELARMLKPYGIPTNTKIKLGDKSVRGYRAADFGDAWSRYLPPAAANDARSTADDR